MKARGAPLTRCRLHGSLGVLGGGHASHRYYRSASEMPVCHASLPLGRWKASMGAIPLTLFLSPMGEEVA